VLSVLPVHERLGLLDAESAGYLLLRPVTDAPGVPALAPPLPQSGGLQGAGGRGLSGRVHPVLCSRRFLSGIRLHCDSGHSSG